MEDIKKGTLAVVYGKTFLQYIHEYQEKVIRSNIHVFAENVGIDEKEMVALYIDTGKHAIDILRLESLEKTAIPAKLKVVKPTNLRRKADMQRQKKMQSYEYQIEH